MTSGDRVIRVSPNLMGQSRRGERQPGKSDQIDARAIARAVLRDGVEQFPSAYLDEQAMEIRLLSDHRQQHMVQTTRLTNRLRWNLVILDPALEASIPSRKMDFPATWTGSQGACAAWSPRHGCGSPKSKSG
jgi:transposase